MWALNNFPTKDAYDAGQTLEVGLARRLRVSVFNAAVFRQILTSPDGEKGKAQWQPELYLAPGTEVMSVNGLFGVRVRSAVAGTPAQVTIQVMAVDE